MTDETVLSKGVETPLTENPRKVYHPLDELERDLLPNYYKKKVEKEAFDPDCPRQEERMKELAEIEVKEIFDNVEKKFGSIKQIGSVAFAGGCCNCPRVLHRGW
jgi:hypothetical protein